jgi:hypothetical protein
MQLLVAQEGAPVDPDDFRQLALPLAVILGVLGTLIFIWLGFKLLLLPLRLLLRFGRALAQQIGPVPLLLILIWTVALEPAPFLYLSRWFIVFGQALLVDAAQQAGPAFARMLESCTRTSSNVCSITVALEGQRLWSAAIGAPVREFGVPPRSSDAALWFAIGTTIACVAALTTTATAQRSRSDLRTIAALTASFTLALYLAIVAIVAIPVFGEKVPDLTPYRTKLAEQLQKDTPGEPAQDPTVDLDAERKGLPEFAALRSLLPKSESPSRISTSLIDSIEPYWTAQLSLWDQTASDLKRAAKALPAEAAEFVRTAQSFFQLSNEGRIGEAATQRHLTVIVNSLNLWISDYRAAVDSCGARLRQDLSSFRNFHSALVPVARTMGETSAIPTDQLSQIGRSLNVTRCADVKPAARDYLPARTGPAETLGPFGAAAAWLLRTESPELALIIGLLGFGFFGALAASFIREFAGTKGYELPSIGFIVPALIRGVGAAILVFLLAKGGTAIFTRGDATPNAYAIFFACFVAAVFSEDVWAWARSRQRTQLPPQDAGPDKPPEPDAKAPTPVASPPPAANRSETRNPAMPLTTPAADWGKYAPWLGRRKTD